MFHILCMHTLKVHTSAMLKAFFCFLSCQHFLGNHTNTLRGVSRTTGIRKVLSISADNLLLDSSMISNEDRDSSKVYNMALVRKLLRYGTAALYFLSSLALDPRTERNENDSYPWYYGARNEIIINTHCQNYSLMM